MSSSDNLYPKKKAAIRKYTALFLSKDSNTVTYADVDLFRSYIHEQIHTYNLSPKQIVKKLNLPYKTDFGGFIKTSLNIKLKDHKSAQKNTAIQKGMAITDTKTLYYQECEFKLSQQEMEKIPGFDLLKDLGIYHPTNNPSGIVRDHILSKAEAYQKGYDPTVIRHPANCQFITNADNIKKSSNSDISYEQLLERISYWDTNIVPALVKKRRTIQRNPEHNAKIKKGILDRLARIRSGELSSRMGKMGGRPETFSKKHNWAVINQHILNGLSCKEICAITGITNDDLMGAKRKGLVIRHPKK